MSERARTTAALGAVEALFSSGRSDEAAALAETSLPAARRLQEELPHAEPVLLGMRALALRLAGRLDAARAQAGDGEALLDVAERFAAADALLVAAEAANAAAAAHRDAGRPASARRAAALAALWLTKCEHARPPTMLGAPEAVDLTPREREIALLAAAGASSREIADRLVISVRTVDNHLQNAYRKLGVTRRQDLPRVLGGTPG